MRPSVSRRRSITFLSFDHVCFRSSDRICIYTYLRRTPHTARYRVPFLGTHNKISLSLPANEPGINSEAREKRVDQPASRVFPHGQNQVVPVTSRFPFLSVASPSRPRVQRSRILYNKYSAHKDMHLYHRQKRGKPINHLLCRKKNFGYNKKQTKKRKKSCGNNTNTASRVERKRPKVHSPVPRTPAKSTPTPSLPNKPRTKTQCMVTSHHLTMFSSSCPPETPGNEKIDSLDLSLALLAVDPRELLSEPPFPSHRRKLLML